MAVYFKISTSFSVIDEYPIPFGFARYAPYSRVRVEYDGIQGSLADQRSRVPSFIGYVQKFNYIQRRSKNSPVFHYTTFENISKILTSGEIWLRPLGDMTDWLDGRHLIEIFNFQAVTRFSKTNVALLKKIHLNLDGLVEAEIFVACFSHAWDSLFHWRSYGKKDGGAIGFATELFEVACDNIPGCSFGDVIYDSDDHHKIVDDFLNEIESLYNQCNAVEQDLFTIPKSIMMRFISAMPFIKNHNYIHEGEIRFVVQGHHLPTETVMVNGTALKIKRLRWREMANLTELDLEIERVLVAPSRDPMPLLKRVDNILTPNEIRFCSVDASSISEILT